MMNSRNVYSTPPWEGEPRDIDGENDLPEVSIKSLAFPTAKASRITEMANFILAQPGLKDWDEDFAYNMKYQFAASASDKQIDKLFSLFERYKEQAKRKSEAAGQPKSIQFPVAWIEALRDTKNANAYKVAFWLVKHPKSRKVLIDQDAIEGGWELNRLGLIDIDKKLNVTLRDPGV